MKLAYYAKFVSQSQLYGLALGRIATLFEPESIGGKMKTCFLVYGRASKIGLWIVLIFFWKVLIFFPSRVCFNPLLF